MAEKRVYAVNEGAYSDYRIVAIFSTRQAAAEYMTAVPNSYYNDIQEFPLDPPTVAKIKSGYHVWLVEMLKNGVVRRIEKRDDYDEIDRPFLIYQPDRGLVRTVWAKDEKHAVKIANELRIRMLAEGTW